MKLTFLSMVILACVPLWAWDLAAVKAEPKLEKRARLAVDDASAALDAAKQAWKQGNSGEMTAKLEEVREAVELALTSLRETGRPPHKLAKHYKYCEVKSRELSRKLDSFALDASLEERPRIEKVNERVQAVHEEFLSGVLSRKK